MIQQKKKKKMDSLKGNCSYHKAIKFILELF